MEGVSKEQVVQYLSQPERCMQIIDHAVNVFIEEGVSIKVEYEESNSSVKYLWVTVVEQIKKEAEKYHSNYENSSVATDNCQRGSQLISPRIVR